MSEGGEKARLVAWSHELRRVHARLRQALAVTRDTSDPRDLLLFCHGFCSALDGHHRGEDRTLFPAIAAAHPQLQSTLRKLEQDHSMIGHLISGLQAAVDRAATPGELQRHLQGVAAIMESHFRYEERMLLTVLEGLALDASPEEVLGPL
ncbi:hemerythrin domain-containing protein [Kineosporia sp. NBRC 101731]|uniref:hemerythrin domain-containing protein n=1 Tax=Kineosporia sp. NBRC 101731 TaxID=3032199 RepID=UPI002552A7D7|nr:hemerythrin domain-containing protein [Kineosporia sp. NBRC 101731]